MNTSLFTRTWLYGWLVAALLSGCKDNNGILLFSVEDDIKLGQQVSEQVDSTFRASGQLLEPNSGDPSIQNAYASLNRILNRVLGSGQVQHHNEFPWSIKIIRDDTTLNAFATPGGYMYVYTGLIQYLEEEDHLAGVLAHEIAHADKRHTARQLQRDYGIALLLSVALGNDPGTLQEIAAQLAGKLAGLRFSRGAETEADNTSVTYLGSTDHYACDGAAGFFQKLNAQAEQANPPEFLSTHPNPNNRVENIQAQASEVGCSTASGPDNDLNQLKKALGL